MPNSSPALTAAEIESFIADGFVRIDYAFPESLAAEGRAILWADTGVDPVVVQRCGRRIISGLAALIAIRQTSLHRALARNTPKLTELNFELILAYKYLNCCR